MLTMTITEAKLAALSAGASADMVNNHVPPVSTWSELLNRNDGPFWFKWFNNYLHFGTTFDELVTSLDTGIQVLDESQQAATDARTAQYNNDVAPIQAELNAGISSLQALFNISKQPLDDALAADNNALVDQYYISKDVLENDFRAGVVANLLT
jgi:hypothetical protein